MFEKLAVYLKEKASLTEEQLEEVRATTINKRLRKRQYLLQEGDVCQDVFASVQEFELYTRIAWGGYPKVAMKSKAYHAWLVTPTIGRCHLWTEGTMRGPHGVELAKQAPDAFWLAHERFLADLARVATACSLWFQTVKSLK